MARPTYRWIVSREKIRIKQILLLPFMAFVFFEFVLAWELFFGSHKLEALEAMISIVAVLLVVALAVCWIEMRREEKETEHEER